MIADRVPPPFGTGEFPRDPLRRRSRASSRLSTGLFASLLLVLKASTLGAQERILILPEPGTPVVATAILLSVGPANEGTDRAGLVYLAARSVVAGIRPSLDSLGARISVTPQKDATSFTVIAAPDAWEEASRILLVALFQDPPRSAAVQRERTEIIAELRGRAANPADAATREMDRAFFGAAHPWGRPTVGTPQSMERLAFTDVAAFVREHFTADRAYAAVVGPVGDAAARNHLRTILGSTIASPVEVIPYSPSVLPVRREYNSITTWVTANFQIPEGGDEDALRLVAYLAAEELSFSPTQRSVYNVSGEMVQRVGGGEIRLQVVIPPEEAGEWAQRVPDAVTRLATVPLLDDVFATHLRRFYGERLMKLISPEERAHEAARGLFVRGPVLSLLPDLEQMTQDRLRNAARSLAPPTVVMLGPIFDAP